MSGGPNIVTTDRTGAISARGLVKDSGSTDVWVAADGDLARLVSAADLEVVDLRDLRMNADARRARG